MMGNPVIQYPFRGESLCGGLPRPPRPAAGGLTPPEPPEFGLMRGLPVT